MSLSMRISRCCMALKAWAACRTSSGPVQRQRRLFQIASQATGGIGQAAQRAQAQTYRHQAHHQHGGDAQGIDPQQVVADQHPRRLATPALQLLAIDDQPVAIGEGYGKLDMRLGGAQAEQAAPDDGLTQFVGEPDLEQPRPRITPQFVGQCLMQQQLDAPPASPLVMLTLGRRFGAT
ncbi:hypothetical protein OKW51_000958 [Pseudomonas hunanensis]|nr:hypothetical protein [Pseudomonas hunanensis]